jgi:hypothetical protein
MEMRRFMIIIIHENNNSVESGDYGHRPSWIKVIPGPSFSIFIGRLARHPGSCQRPMTSDPVSGGSKRNPLFPMPGLVRAGELVSRGPIRLAGLFSQAASALLISPTSRISTLKPISIVFL